jgi:hypothetical protein
VQIGADHERRGGRHQAHIGRGPISGEVDHAARQQLRREKCEAARVGLALREVEQRHAGCAQQVLHQRRIGRRHHGQRVDAALHQLDHGVHGLALVGRHGRRRQPVGSSQTA